MERGRVAAVARFCLPAPLPPLYQTALHGHLLPRPEVFIPPRYVDMDGDGDISAREAKFVLGLTSSDVLDVDCRGYPPAEGVRMMIGHMVNELLADGGVQRTLTAPRPDFVPYVKADAAAAAAATSTTTTHSLTSPLSPGTGSGCAPSRPS